MRAVWICAVIASLSPLDAAHADGEGLAADVDRVPWVRFQTRLVTGADPAWRASLAPVERSGLQVGGVGVLGDVYLGAHSSASARLAAPAGFRATGGVIMSARSPLWGGPSPGPFGSDRRTFGANAAPTIGPTDNADSGTVPYIGVGYSSLQAKSGWRFSADLGVVSQNPANAVRFGRALGSPQTLDDVVRDMRLAPLIQLGVSYSF